MKTELWEDNLKLELYFYNQLHKEEMELIKRRNKMITNFDITNKPTLVGYTNPCEEDPEDFEDEDE